MEVFISKRDDSALAVRLEAFNQEDIAKIKSLPGRRWVPEQSVWSLPYTIVMIEQILNLFQEFTIHIEAQLLEECYLLQDWHNSRVERSDIASST